MNVLLTMETVNKYASTLMGDTSVHAMDLDFCYREITILALVRNHLFIHFTLHQLFLLPSLYLLNLFTFNAFILWILKVFLWITACSGIWKFLE